jgi:hypothetical protein
MKPGDVRCIPAASGQTDTPIGAVILEANGSLSVYLDSTAGVLPDGTTIERSSVTYKPTDPSYEVLMKRFDGIKTGEERLIFAPKPPPPVK